MGSHAAVMGVKFYTGKMFPAEYRNAMRRRSAKWETVALPEGEEAAQTALEMARVMKSLI